MATKKKKKDDVPKAKVSQISWDWKSMPDLDDLTIALKPFGVHVYEDPYLDGTDQYGFVFSDRKGLSEDEVRKLVMEDDG